MKSEEYLMCEKNWVFYTLILISVYYGAFTYVLRGNVFCNAQTGNVVLMGMALGSGNIRHVLYYLIPIGAYMLGSVVSELLPNPVKHILLIRWDTVLILIEMIVVFCLGFVPESAPVQISQVTINFVASMQYNTFRQAQGTPMATTFATNHIRQIGIGIAKEIKGKDTTHRKKLFKHIRMLLCFLSGATIGTVLCHLFLGRAIWVTLIPLGILLSQFIKEDVHMESLEQVPHGH